MALPSLVRTMPREGDRESDERRERRGKGGGEQRRAFFLSLSMPLPTKQNAPPPASSSIFSMARGPSVVRTMSATA